MAAAARSFPEQPYVSTVAFICSEEGKAQFEESLKSEQPDRVIVAACSPRDHEATFRRCLTNAGLNPYLMQRVNIREQIAWVTKDPAMATDKAIRALRGAVCRVRLHQPLEKMHLEICPDALVSTAAELPPPLSLRGGTADEAIQFAAHNSGCSQTNTSELFKRRYPASHYLVELPKFYKRHPNFF